VSKSAAVELNRNYISVGHLYIISPLEEWRHHFKRRSHQRSHLERAGCIKTRWHAKRQMLVCKQHADTRTAGRHRNEGKMIPAAES
jgi:hypothetical protein